ncbi:unnamed protein product [Cochlearia groenlandica]
MAKQNSRIDDAVTEIFNREIGFSNPNLISRRISASQKKGGKLVKAMVGDRSVVNQLEPHPHMLLFLASCGIEKSVKIWTPMSNVVLSLPENIEKVMESNRVGREDHSMVTLTPYLIMHVLRLQRQQTSVFTERRYVLTDDDDSEEGNNEA